MTEARKKTIILTDCDGVLLDWETAFTQWMADRGEHEQKCSVSYDISIRYGIKKNEARRLVKLFNESAAIAYLKPLRDSVEYVQKLHDEYGYVFRVITSLSEDKWAGMARRENLKRYFGDAIDHVVCLPCGGDKDEALAKYTKPLYWIEDKVENCDLGIKLGLKGILVAHEHNADYSGDAVRVQNWKEIFDYIKHDQYK